MNTPNQFLDNAFDKPKNYLGFDRKMATNLVSELNILLSNYNVYYQNLRNFHWNISGENFFDLHNQFESLYNDARIKIDEIAERILTLRHRPLSRMTDYLKISEIKEATLLEEDRAMILTTLENHRILIIRMRSIMERASELKDEGTADMIGGFLENIEKKSWMLDAWATRKLEAVPA
ncbi:MAG: starvation-inducible DNA-binding protein [Saprospiraceae bacterium]|jgi:starvation-inducible DNA-binding protein